MQPECKVRMTLLYLSGDEGDCLPSLIQQGRIPRAPGH